MAARRRRTIATVLATAVAVAAFGLGACSKGGDDNASFCAAVRSAPSLESVLVGFTAQDPAELGRRLDKAQAAYATVRSSAPKAVHDDVTTIVDVVDQLIAAVRAHPNDPDAVRDRIRSDVADHQGVAAATVAVADYARDHCDVELNPGVTVDQTTSTTTAR